MNYQNDDLRIKEIKELLPPVALLEKFPATENAANTVAHARKAIHKILKGNDDRLLVVIGPCSIHDPVAAKEYATRLLALREELKDELEIVMRVYFEKPRTTVGWKGLINDPHMDNSFQINDGLRIARKLLLDINDSGLPAAGEFLDMITPQYLADLMSWGAIGARTTESQVHRELASGLSCPVFTPLLSTLFGATFSRASGATWPASAAAFAWPLLVCAPLSAASAAPLARLRVAVRNNVASFVIFIGCSCYGRYVG